MSSIIVANFTTGFETDRPPFLLNNDAFPILNNAFILRGRLKKKRGTTQLGRLQRTLVSASAGMYSTINGTNTLNIFTALGLLSTEPNSNLLPGNKSTITIVFGSAINQTLTDSTGSGTFVVSGSGTSIVSATINYATGIITIIGNAATGPSSVTVSLAYYPSLAVMGIEDFNINFNTPGNTNFPRTVFFDTKYSYQFTSNTGPFYDVNYYVSTGLHFTWSGADYQQFWTQNYQGAMFTTNGNPGFNFKLLTNTLAGTKSVLQTGATTVTIGLTAHGLSNNDVVYINEVSGTIGTGSGSTANQNINGQFGIVTVIDANSFTLTVTGANFQSGAVGTGGIGQYLTNTILGQDGIKYYIGDPTGPTLTKGWVNFSPPLSNASAPQYLVGCKMIIPFKNRLLFFGTYTQTSTGQAIYNPNQMVSCQNGTVFYAGTSNDILPPNQTSDPTSFYQNVVGKGIRLNAPFSQEVINVAINNDVILVMFEKNPLKLYSTGDDSAPFLYQTISSEYGGQSTFSSVPLDEGMLSISPYGFTITDQVKTERIDLTVLDTVFDISQENNGLKRVCAIRDFRNEFVYFTFPSVGSPFNPLGQKKWVYPTSTLAYNYRDKTWSTFTENYTTYGLFRYDTALTWAQLGAKYGTWANWQDPWNFGGSEKGYPSVACGNQQGFVMLKTENTNESDSQYISNFGVSGQIYTITSPNHNLNNDDYIIPSGAIGLSNFNGQVFQIGSVTTNTFQILLSQTQFVTPPTGSYLGGGTYTRLTNITVQTKQFPVFWAENRQTRIGTQRYLFTKTQNGQVTINLYTSQNVEISANDPVSSAYLPFTNVLLTSPEPNSLNLLQYAQDQIWHRINTSVIGDTVQLGITLSDAQMRNTSINQEEIELFAFVITIYPGPTLAF